MLYRNLIFALFLLFPSFSFGQTILTTTPGGSESGMVTRNIPSGTQPISGTLTCNEGGAPWTQRIQDGVGTTLATVTAANAVKVDGSAVTQPISAASLPLPAGAATAANQLPAGHTVKLLDTAGVNQAAVTAANALKVDNSAVTQPVSIAAAVDISDRAARLVGQVEGRAASGAAKAGNPNQVGGVFNTTQPTVTTGQAVEAQATARGALIVATGADAFTVAAHTVNQGTSAGVGSAWVVNPWGTANTVGNVGQATGPLAGAAIVTIASTSLPAGTYKIDVTIGYGSGVVAAAERNNMEVRAGATTITGLSISDTANFSSTGPAVFRRALDGTTALSVNATAAGTGTANYLAQILATRID